jgi:predicted nucleic acid-binding protein
MSFALLHRTSLNFGTYALGPVDVNGLGHSIAATDRLTSDIEMFFTILPDTNEVFRSWRHLIVTYEVRGAKVHDARLVALMQTYGLERILTFNVGDFRRYAGIVPLHPAIFS